jgi:hypothetical protein
MRPSSSWKWQFTVLRDARGMLAGDARTGVSLKRGAVLLRHLRN